MHMNLVSVIILFYSYHCVKSVTPCYHILKNKGYNAVISEAMYAPYKGRSKNCRVEGVVSSLLFKDRDAVLCLKNISELTRAHAGLFVRSDKPCKVEPEMLKAIHCKFLKEFDHCIQMHMKITLEGVAYNDPKTRNACSKCKEYPLAKKCVMKALLYKKCPAVISALSVYQHGARPCQICENARIRNEASSEPSIEPRSAPRSEPMDDLRAINETSSKSDGNSSTAKVIVIVVAVSIVVLIVLIGVGYYRFKQVEMNRELERIKVTKTGKGEKLSFTSLKSGDTSSRGSSVKSSARRKRRKTPGK